MVNRVGRKAPPLTGTSGKTCFSATRHMDMVVPSEMFIGPRAVGAVPVKSKCRSEPATVMASFTAKGVSSTPSLSNQSSTA